MRSSVNLIWEQRRMELVWDWETETRDLGGKKGRFRETRNLEEWNSAGRGGKSKQRSKNGQQLGNLREIYEKKSQEKYIL